MFKRILILLSLMVWAFPAKADLAVHFLDVGHGDCAIIQCDGQAAIIDGGNSESSQLVYAYISQLGISRMEYVFATHPDADHIGGLPAVFHVAEVGKLFSPVLSHDTERFETLSNTAASSNVAVETLKEGDTIPLGGSVMTILNAAADTSDTNDLSFVIRLDYGDTSFLFCADAGTKVETRLLESGVDVDVDVLKVSHHGSSSGTLLQFVQAASPQYAVISSSRKYDNLDEEVVHKLLSSGAHILHTLQNGHIIIQSDGTSVLVSCDDYYVVNTNSKRLHDKGCPSVEKMKEKNKEIIFTREEAIYDGYKPCKNCGP